MKIISIIIILISTFCFSQIDISTINKSYKINPKPIIIYFYTDWCSVCKIQDKQFEKDEILKNEINNQVYLIKFDAESSEDVLFFGHQYKSNTTTLKKEIHELVYEFISPQEVNFPLWIILDENLNILGKYIGLIKNKELKKVLFQVKNSIK